MTRKRDVPADVQAIANSLSRKKAAQVLAAEREKDEPRENVVGALLNRLEADREEQEVRSSA